MKVKNMPAKSQTLRLLAVDPATLLGGAELFMLDFLRFLSRKRTISCTLATSGISDYIDQVPKPITVKMIEMPRLTKTWRSFLDVRAARNRLVDLIRKNKIEIILSNSIRAHLIATLAARKTRVPIVWMIHDFTFPRWLLRWLIKTPVQIMCVSESVRTYIVHATNSKWAGKITVVPNGVDLKRIDQLRAASIALPQKHQEVWVGNLGRIEPWKGQRQFIEVAQKVLVHFPRGRFFIIGAPAPHDPIAVAYFEEIKKMVAHARLTSKIFFTGYLPNVYPLLCQLDIVAHTAIEPEPFGRVVIEAMAMGKAVVASPLGGPSEIIESDRDGTLCDVRETTRFASILLEWMQDSTKRSMIGKAAKAKVTARYQSSQVHDQMLHLLSSHATCKK